MARSMLVLGFLLASLAAAVAEDRPQAPGALDPGAVPLTDAPGDAARGRAIVADRRKSFCLLCHSGPIPEERFMGNLAPPLDGAGARWSAAALRLRLIDASRLNPDTIMPPYFRTEGFERMAPALRGRTILTAQEIEDVVAYLVSLRE
ncbi:sulfur oxidation c-type cytochrome SoxX [Phreatobacter stygius]|uniref:Sulfur oxidation c-type cytochrome SoxX n=1 Tax=Phreatobacter stygius TaxID=1940610 RepID=A0A4D7AZU8_9HYPH|nr:sulfur oxidation c-type cytochrome SoxX [Phreatobacter stygius]QCI64148.1 sulfur oxidation c-type cytochrome SoxX [Phreatobacter stygius]